MDIWAVSSLQWPEEGAEDVYLEFQGASWTHLLGCVRFLAGTWIVFPQRLRSGRLEDVISRVWLIWASARWPEHCLLFEKRLPCRGKLRTCSWQPTAEVPDKTVSNSRAVGQSSNSQQRWKVAALPGSTENPALVSWPGTLQLRLGLVLTRTHKDGCKLQKPTGAFSSLLMCNWVWCLYYIKLVWSVLWLKENMCACVYACVCVSVHAQLLTWKQFFKTCSRTPWQHSG